MAFLLFPKEFDPRVASGPPSLNEPEPWTPEDTLRHKYLASQAVLVKEGKPPPFRWTMQVDNEKDIWDHVRE